MGCYSLGRGIGRRDHRRDGVAMKALSTVLRSQMLADAAAFRSIAGRHVGGFRGRQTALTRLLKRRGADSWCVGEPDALRGRHFFVDRLSQESMPVAGLVFNRAPDAVRGPDRAGNRRRRNVGCRDHRLRSLAQRLLRIHAEARADGQTGDPAAVRFTRANPTVPVAGTAAPF